MVALHVFHLYLIFLTRFVGNFLQLGQTYFRQCWVNGMSRFGYLGYLFLSLNFNPLYTLHASILHYNLHTLSNCMTIQFWLDQLMRTNLFSNSTYCDFVKVEDFLGKQGKKLLKWSLNLGWRKLNHRFENATLSAVVAVVNIYLAGEICPNILLLENLINKSKTN